MANNILYAKKIGGGKLALECEELTHTDKYNEYVMTRFRTLKGMSLSGLRKQFGEKLYAYALNQAKVHLEAGRVSVSGDYMRVTELGRFQTDGDRKSTRLNSSHVAISYAVFCLKKKT